MVGGTLRDVRAEIRSLARPDGDYAIVCGRTGSEPGAATGRRFPDRRVAAEAAELTRDYRAALRRYDPNIPYDDPQVYEVSKGPPRSAAAGSEDDYTRYSAFCHDTAGALFEALSELGHREAETAAMETYLTLAEVVDDHDDFCLTLVWSLMSELDVRLSPAEQRAVVEAAADLFCPTATPNPVDATLGHLETAGFVEGYSVRPIPDAGADVGAGGMSEADGRTDARTDGDDSSRTWELTFGDYALAERTGRIPTLPIAVSLLRRTPGRAVRFIDGEALSDGRWRLRVRMTPEGDSAGLVSVEAAENRWLNDPSASLGR
ncbi:hypothetical protein C5B91_03800 [Haloferax sp. Atlit-10N]|uniref:DUF7551 domain-containing protein n=1 Tax=unclassified Haloferax TaxID=2625095 RepID=UPI000E286A04|nr:MULTISPECIES: hypothetical protein [unclassified Haloferax]RDZ46800.1 hypothetical protein C5B87_03800 [Haloferax sp. Atlit-16N]RDZ60632.1 hypothetical protein C5B91_03800 [Haloferax sp. Atlit-10N]